MKRLYSIPAAVLAAGLILTGCSQGAENTAENLIESATGADVDLSDGSVTVTDEEGNVIESGSDVALPDDFPSDLPQPDGGTIVTASTMDGQVIVVWSMQGLTADDVDAYVAQVKAAGYGEERDSASLGGDGVVSKTVTLAGNGKVITITGSTVEGLGQILVNISDDA